MKILNFGSLNIDYVYSVVNFVRSGETIKALSRDVFCGGKGLNQSVALARAGAEVWHSGSIGDDGKMLKNLLEDSGVKTEYIRISGATGHAIIQVDSFGENCIIINGGANREIDKPFINKVLKNFEKGDMLLLQNEINNIPYIMEAAYERGLQIAINPSPITEELLKYPFELVKWFIINRNEGELLTGESEPQKIADSLLSRYNNSAVILTLGSEGAVYIDGQQHLLQPSYKVKVVDTTGAGDTFAGYFLSGIAQGLSEKAAMLQASKAAALAVTKKGAAISIPTLGEVLRATFD
jgi:ribokinase